MAGKHLGREPTAASGRRARPVRAGVHEAAAAIFATLDRRLGGAVIIFWMWRASSIGPNDLRRSTPRPTRCRTVQSRLAPRALKSEISMFALCVGPAVAWLFIHGHRRIRGHFLRLGGRAPTASPRNDVHIDLDARATSRVEK